MIKGTAKTRVVDLSWRETVQQRLAHALVKGITDWIVEDTEEARLLYDRPIEGDRKTADGQHEHHRRRFVWLRQNVFAASSQIGPCRETISRPPLDRRKNWKAAIRAATAKFG